MGGLVAGLAIIGECSALRYAGMSPAYILIAGNFPSGRAWRLPGNLIRGDIMNTETSATLQSRKWYRMATGPGDSVLVSPIRETGTKLQSLDFATGCLIPEGGCWEGITENGRPVSHLTDRSIDRLGIGGLRGPVDELPDLTDDDIRALRGKYEQARRQEEEKAAAAATAREDRRHAIRAEHSHLETMEATKKSAHALGAANIKRELRKAFPGVKFSAKSDSFAGGDSIDVHWEYGPLVADVEKVTDKYQDGHFNGMEDIYENDRENVWPDVFGGAKYVNASRTIPTPNGNGVDWFGGSIYGDIGRALCELQGVEYAGEYTQHVFGESDSDTLCDHVRSIVYKTAFPVGGEWTFKGIEYNKESYEWDCVFDVPEVAKSETVPKSATQRATAPAGGVTVSEHTHTKKGFQMWVVELAGRVERDTFTELRDIARSGGGWYSRAWKGTPAGFAFKEEDRAQEFAAIAKDWEQ